MITFCSILLYREPNLSPVMSANDSTNGKNKMILFALVLGTFMTALDATIVSVALPTMAQELGEAGHDTQNISWVLLIYTLMLCCFILLWL